jgi:hypothetical protein
LSGHGYKTDGCDFLSLYTFVGIFNQEEFLAQIPYRDDHSAALAELLY